MVITTELFENVPLSPRAPEDLYFSEGRKAWVASRYGDVLSALRSSDLSQTGPPRVAADVSVKQDREKIRAKILTALPSSRTSKWQIQISELASVQLQPLSRHHPVDLVSQFIQPWCLASAIALTGIDPAHSDSLASLVSDLSQADAAPDDLDLQSRAKEANHELDCIFRTWSAPSFKSLFLGVAQTSAYFLASAWAALLQHPSQAKQLQKCPGYMPKAVEELLRYAGPVHSLFRQADRDIEICGTKIERGGRLILRLASANRDSKQFPDPDRLDLTREVAGHLALSSGPHGCVGASLVRMMTAVGINAILARPSEPRLSKPVEWSCGSMLIWPSSLPVLVGNSAFV